MAVEGQKSYQRALRVIGHYLDREPAYRISISEVADGFSVRSHPAPGKADERVKHFQWEGLDHLDTYYAGWRGGGSPSSRYQRLWENFPCGHEKALRKLGAVLDDEGATNLSVDEAESGIDVSYTCANADSPNTEDKRERVFAPGELCDSL